MKLSLDEKVDKIQMLNGGKDHQEIVAAICGEYVDSTNTPKELWYIIHNTDDENAKKRAKAKLRNMALAELNAGKKFSDFFDMLSWVPNDLEDRAWSSALEAITTSAEWTQIKNVSGFGSRRTNQLFKKLSEILDREAAAQT